MKRTASGPSRSSCRRATRERLGGAQIAAIGALSGATLAFFDWETKKYQPIPVREQVEVASLIGDIAIGPDGKPSVHAHAVLGRRDGTAVLPLLAGCAGEGGAAVDVALAYGLAARQEADRVAAVDAVLALAASGGLDPAGVGSRLGDLGRQGLLTWSRCVAPLRDTAAAGAPLATWRMLAAALPTALAVPRPPAGTPDLLTLAAETAAATGERIDVPGLAAVAGRRGSSRLVTEARRLAAAIG